MAELVSIKRNVDVSPGQAAPAVFHCSQGDVGSKIILGLLNNGTAYSIPSGVTVTIEGSESNGSIFTPISATASGSDITFYLTGEMTAVAGPAICQAVLKSGSNILGTANFTLEVESSPMGADAPPVFTDAGWTWMLNKLTTEFVPALNDNIIDAIESKADQSDLETLESTVAGHTGSIAVLNNSIGTINDSIVENRRNIDKKLDKDQGTANAGKYLKVGANGNVETADLDVTTDKTLSIADKAADAKAVGDEITDLKADKIPFPVSPYLKYGSSGQLLRTKGNGNTEWVDFGLPTDEQTAEAIADWLDEHPEATTTVEDGSLTETKFSDTLKLKSINAYVTPEMFGAVGDGVTDDSEAIQKMLDEAPLESVCVMLNEYYCGAGLLVTRAINVYMYGRCKFSNTLEYAFRVYGHGAKRNTFRLNLACLNAKDTWQNRSIIGLDMWACQQNTFDVYLEGFKTGIRLLAGNTTSEVDCDYNKIFIRCIYNCQYAIYLDGLTGSGSLAAGTVSQNTFIGGRVGVQGASYTWLGQEDTPNNCYWAVRSELKAGRTNNNNTFLAVSFEGFGVKSSPYENRARVTLDFAFCMYLNCRYEGMTKITKTVPGVTPSYVIGGYGADDIYEAGNMFIGNKKINLTPYQNPLVLQRIGSGDRYLEIKAVNGTMISLFEGKYFYLPTIVLLPDGKPYGSVTAANSMKFLYEYHYGSPRTSMEYMGNGEWRITNFGHIVSKNRAGNKTFDIQPIYTTKPNFDTIETGTMVFVNGRPQWYDGEKWVYADGTTAT